MKVLIVSSSTPPAAPIGPAYVAGALRAAGHTVAVYENLLSGDLAHALPEELLSFRPDVVGLSIRVVHEDALDPSAPWGTRHRDLRPDVRQMVDIVRRNSRALIVLGGPGFNYYAADWLEYLDLEYGIRGEGEEAFPLFLQRMAEGGDPASVPGCVRRSGGRIVSVPPRRVEDWERAALPAYELFDLAGFPDHHIDPAIFTKRGCAFLCTFCPYGKLEGRGYRLKSPSRVLAEIRHILRHARNNRILFCDNSFNVPRRHAEAICRVLRDERLNVAWGTGDLKPLGVSDDFCRLMEESGCVYVNLAVESASDSMLKSMRRGYSARHVRESLDALSRSKLPFGVSIMIGAPGESPQTVAETLKVLDGYAIPCGVWVTVGVYLWTDYQDVVGDARRSGFLQDEGQLFSGAVFLSPDISKQYLEELIPMLRARPGYKVQVNQPIINWN
ncbi:MAG: radical SAM protein [Anaerolineales bacterium]|nr:radical SAM protein [Anaerolineales bacterium]